VPTNRQYRLAARPVGLPKNSDWQVVEEPLPSPEQGEFVVKIEYISLDPAMRGWMNERRSYLPPVGIGDVMRAGTVGQVIDSRNDDYLIGDRVSGWFGVQQYARTDGRGVTKIDTRMAPLPVWLSVLGLPGLTAYFGLLDIGEAKEGDTVVVSAAAGAVGSVAGQIAKLKGCRVVGIAGGPMKCSYIVDELGFDAAIDYKSERVRPRLRELCPDRVNVYFDNVGGDILDDVLTVLARHARIVVCGAVSQYNRTGRMHGPSNYMTLLVDRARMEGFLVFDYTARYPEAVRQMAGWMAAGKLKSREDIVEGFDNFPSALRKLFRGANFGKLVIRV
jgi:NADPH-dependent curcumin reductase CurA